MRNRQVVRQWAMLKALAGRRDLTVERMSAEFGVSARTVRRDLEVLQEAQFPIVDEVISDDGLKRWRLMGRLDLAA